MSCLLIKLHAGRTQCNNDRMQTRLRSLAILEILVSREISLDVGLSLQQVAWYGRPSDKWVSLTTTTEICTRCPKNVTTLSRHNADIGLHESILTVFGTNVAKKVGSQKVLYFLASSSACAQFLAKWRKTKIAWFYSNAVLLHYQTNQSITGLMYSVFTCNLMLMLLYDSLNLTASEVMLWTVTEP